MHPTHLVELPHRCIDDRVTRQALAPRSKIILRVRPDDVLAALEKRAGRDVWKATQNRLVKIAPDEFADPRLDILARLRVGSGATRERGFDAGPNADRF